MFLEQKVALPILEFDKKFSFVEGFFSPYPYRFAHADFLHYLEEIFNTQFFIV